MPRYLVTALLLGTALMLAACGGVSDEEFETAQQELSTEKAMVADLKGQLAEAQAVPAPQAPRTLNVLAGAGQDTSAVFGFFPSTIRIRAGDTVVWNLNSDEFQQITFTSGEGPPEPFLPVPGGSPGQLMLNPQDAFPSRPPGAPVETYSGTGFFNSGGLSKEAQGPPGTPPNDTFSLTFDTPGTYEYGGTGKGKVIVEPLTPLMYLARRC